MRVAALVVVAAVSVGSCTSNGAGAPPPTTSPTTTETTTTATAAPAQITTTTPSTIVESSTTSIAATTTTTIPVPQLRHPILDPVACPPTLAGEFEHDDFELAPFARGRLLPKALQVIADADLGFDGPFALLIRYPEPPSAPGDREPPYQPVETGAGTAWVTVHSTGSAEAIWDLPDGGQAYIRGLGFDVEMLTAMVAALTPADRASPDELPIPPFEFDPAPGPASNMTVLVSGPDTGASGSGSWFRCESGSGAYTGAVVRGDPLLVAAFVLDQPAPYSYGVRAGAVLSLQGFWTPHDRPLDAPTVDDLIEAEPEVWTELLAVSG